MFFLFQNCQQCVVDIDRDLKYFTPKQVQISPLMVSHLVSDRYRNVLSESSFGVCGHLLSVMSFGVCEVILCPRGYLVSQSHLVSQRPFGFLEVFGL